MWVATSWSNCGEDELASRLQLAYKSPLVANCRTISRFHPSYSISPPGRAIGFHLLEATVVHPVSFSLFSQSHLLCKKSQVEWQSEIWCCYFQVDEALFSFVFCSHHSSSQIDGRSDEQFVIDVDSVEVERRHFLEATSAITPASHGRAVTYARSFSAATGPLLEGICDRSWRSCVTC